MRRIFQLFTFALAFALLVVPAARSASSDMVVSQVFAGGGNTGAPYTNDYVELFNRGATTVDLFSTWSIQYATGSGTTWQGDAAVGIRPGGRPLPDSARFGGGDRRLLADTRRHRDEQPRCFGRQGRAGAFCDRAHLRCVRR